MNMDETMIEERFHTAVDIIKSLPKSGSIQPSNDTKLKFYSFFKQATEGPCELPKPGFWDVINRAKWDAWHKLGNMSRQEAMKGYVQEFVKIIQATPIESLDDPNILNDFLGMMGPYMEYAPEEIKMKHMLMNGKINKPLNNNSEDYVEEYNGPSSSTNGCKDFSNKLSDDGSELSPVNGHSMNGGNESDSDIFSDTLEGVNEDDLVDATGPLNNNPVPQGPSILTFRGGDHRSGAGNGNSPAGASGGRGNRQNRPGATPNWSVPMSSNSNLLGNAGGSRRSGGGGLPSEFSSDVNEQLALAVIRLQHTMEHMLVRLDSLESLLLQKKAATSSSQVAEKGRRSIFGMSPKLAVLIFTWPLIVQLLIFYIRRRHKRL